MPDKPQQNSDIAEDVCNPVCNTRPDIDGLARPIASPSGADGLESGRDTQGRFVAGNSAALKSGSRATAFWAAAEGAYVALRNQLLSDRGYTPESAPAGLLVAVNGCAQNTVLRDWLFNKVIENAGPLSTKDKVRAVAREYASASDRALKHVQVVGLTRTTKDEGGLWQD